MRAYHLHQAHLIPPNPRDGSALQSAAAGELGVGGGGRPPEEQRRRRLKQDAATRDWSGLPVDVLLVVFKKLGSFFVLFSARQVCRTWKLAADDPANWRRIDFGHPKTLGRFHWLAEIRMEAMAKRAVRLAAGKLEELCIEDYGTNALLRYIGESSTSLRSLRLISCYQVTNIGLEQIVPRLPLLKELEVTYSWFREDLYVNTIALCPNLTCFRLNTKWYKFDHFDDPDFCNNSVAFAIAAMMHNLSELQLVGNQMDNEGLMGLLYGCPKLELLDIRHCYNLVVDEDGELAMLLARVKEVRYLKSRYSDYVSDLVANDDGFLEEESDYVCVDGRVYDYKECFYVNPAHFVSESDFEFYSEEEGDSGEDDD